MFVKILIRRVIWTITHRFENALRSSLISGATNVTYSRMTQRKYEYPGETETRAIKANDRHSKFFVSNIRCYSNRYEEIIEEKLLDLSLTKLLWISSVQAYDFA